MTRGGRYGFGSVARPFSSVVEKVASGHLFRDPSIHSCVSNKTFLLLLRVACLAAGFGAAAFAQDDDVQHRSRARPRRLTQRNPAGRSERHCRSFCCATHTKPMQKDVDLVLVPVTITDPMNRLVTGLEKDNFQLTDNGQPQEIRHFSSEDAPISLGVIFDISGSMTDKIDKSRQAVVEFFRTANPQDEFFLVTFSGQTRGAGRLHLFRRGHPEQAGLCHSQGPDCPASTPFTSA